MKLMQPIASDDIPHGKQWSYEVKYDGFRALLTWEKESISFISRSGKDLSNSFPEIIAYCQNQKEMFAPFLPLQLDGELVILNNDLQANFPLLQQRGRLQSQEKIAERVKERPASFLVFDLLNYQGNKLKNESFHERKNRLEDLFDKLKGNERIKLINNHADVKLLWQRLFTYKGEGIVAKRLNSYYEEGKNHSNWFKIKNWRTIKGIITSYVPENGYFGLSVFHQNQLKAIGKFKHGLESEELETVKDFIYSKGEKHGESYSLPPAICAEINCLDVKENELREPVFNQFRFDITPEECTLAEINKALAMFPKEIELSNQQKVFWHKPNITKGDLLGYLREIAPLQLPFLDNKALTIIRCPDGVANESFFQKNSPDYAPDFVAGPNIDGEKVLQCKGLEALIWLGNHGAVEYHVPFQQLGHEKPDEIVFDLDPPSKKEFQLAVQAAQLLKKLLDQLQLRSFIKTSGNKGLQIYIPIPLNSMNYQETATFTQALALLLENQYPTRFTTERLKKNRKGRLYVDYVQHGKGKTLIAPYSPRKTDLATVSAPLYWEEVNDQLHPDKFTIETIGKRIQQLGCPFANYKQAGEEQNLTVLKEFIKD